MIASRDEIDIEADLVRLLEKESRFREVESYRTALRLIDRLREDGRLDQERKRLAGLMNLPTEEDKRRMSNRLTPIDDMLENLYAGMESPDPIQRKRFRRAWNRIKDLAVYDDEVQTWLPILEKAPKKRGHRRRLYPPWRNDDASLKRMRDLVLGGQSIVEASQLAAREENHAADEYQTNRAHSLQKRYKLKMALREESP